MRFTHYPALSALAVLAATTSATALQFKDACRPGQSITIGAVGDVMMHAAMQHKAYRSGSWKKLWPDIIPYMKAPDLMYANLESPTAKGLLSGGKKTADPGPRYDKKVYTGFPHFNAHPVVIKELKASGVDILSTANNHSMDRGPKGVNLTIEALQKAGIAFSGTVRSKKDTSYAITRQGGFTLAWISCTRDTNGLPDPKRQVKRCYDGSVTKTIGALKSKVDAVIIMPHWGQEYVLSANQRQKSFARKWINAGALAVLGAHPHVPQPWEKITATDGREGFVIYSLGNFIAAQTALPKKTSMLLYLGLTKSGGKTRINGVQYLPLYMQHFPHKVVPTGYPGQRPKGHAESLALLHKMYGADRMLKAGKRIDTAGC